MKRKVYIGALLSVITVLVLSSCASDEEKIPAVGVEIANRAFELSEKVKESFLDGERETLKSLCSENLYNKLSSKMTGLAGWKIDFKMRWVDINEDGTIHLYVSWKRRAEQKESEVEMSGLALFIIKEDPFIAEEIKRENPFY